VSTADRLLPGEDPESRSAEEAEKWIRIYARLLDWNEVVLKHEQSRRRRADADMPSMGTVLLEHDLYSSRLRFWRLRLADLDPNNPSSNLSGTTSDC